MKWIITTIFASWVVAEVLCGGHSCKVSRKKDCVRKIDCGFTRETKTVTVRHILLSGKEETVAVCDWLEEAFICDAAGGYSVNITSATTLLLSIDSEVTCPNGRFVFTNNGHGLVICSSDTGELEPLEPEEQVTTGCQEGTEAEHDDKNRFKRSIARKCPHNPSNKDTADNKLIAPVVVPVVVILIIVTLAAAAAAAAVAFSIRRKRGRKKQIQDTSDVELSLTQEKEMNEHI